MMLHPDMEPADAAEWRSFVENPSRYADPRRLAACFGDAIGDAACERMLRSERLQTRLSKLLVEHHRLSGSMPVAEGDDIDRTIALMPAEDLDEIALRAGAIHWAGSFAGIILGQKAAALHEALGEELCAFAVANRDLAGPAQSLDPVEGVRERVVADGWRCLGAWCRAVPVAIGMRVRLKLPPDDLIDAMPVSPFAEAGPGIVRRAVS
jgi:hypothetical protein